LKISLSFPVVKRIGIARQHSMSPDISPVEKRTAEQVKLPEMGLNSSTTWKATYLGSGKWSVTLNIPLSGTEKGLSYRWTIFEKNLSAVFIDETALNP
jgi:hypothetical protein